MTNAPGALKGLLYGVLLTLLVSFSAVVPAMAQLSGTQQAYVTKWLATAKRAEAAIKAGKASNAAFESLRDEIAGYRGAFEDARQQNAARIATLQSQLTALGPKPAEGQSEPTDIAALREQLTSQVNKLRVPVVVAHEAESRANGMIREIDRIIRERKTGRLFSRSVTPLDPSLWPTAFREVEQTVIDIFNETRTRLGSQIVRQTLRERALQILLVVALGLLFLVRGRVWAVRLGERLRRLGSSGFGVWGFVISLGKILLPLVGVILITQSIALAQILGHRGELILAAIPLWAATLLQFLWLGDRLYPDQEDDALVPMHGGNRRAARRVLLAMGATLVLQEAVALFEQIENVSDGVRAVIGLPAILLGAGVLVRLRQILRDEVNTRAQEGQEGQEPVRRQGLMTAGPFLRRVSGIVALAVPLLAIAGYGALAEAVIYPWLQSIALYGLLIVLQKFLGDLYAWLSGKGRAAADSVVPVLIGFLLALAALPGLALIWGARVSDLTEMWNRFLQGVSVGGVQISPSNFLTFVVVFAIGYSLTQLVQRSLATNLLPKTRLDQGGQTAVVSGVKYLGVFLSALLAVSMAGIDLSSLAIVAGALSVGIGFGLQTIVSNFVSGIILLIERPISEGDWIEVGGNMGYVRDISVRSTRIETFDRTDVIIPNSDLISGTVTNYTRGNTIGRVIVPVGVAYGTDTRLVEKILREVAEGQDMILSNPAPSVVFKEFGADSLNFEVRGILRDVNWVLSVRSDMNFEINRRFAEAGIEIPFAQRDVWLRNPEALRGVATSQQAPGQDKATPPDQSDLEAEGDGDD